MVTFDSLWLSEFEHFFLAVDSVLLTRSRCALNCTTGVLACWMRLFDLLKFSLRSHFFLASWHSFQNPDLLSNKDLVNYYSKLMLIF